MRIAIVSTSYPPHAIGGAERSVQELARGLATAGHTVRVLCLGTEDSSGELEADGDVQVKRFPSVAFRPFSTAGKSATRLGKLRWHVQEMARLATYRFLRREFRDFRPDVIHANNLAGFGWLAWRAAGRTPLVHTTRDFYLSCMASTHWRNGAACSPDHLPCRISKAPFRLSRRRPHLFVGVSNDIIDRHRRYGTIRTGEMSQTIYNNPHLTAPDRPRPDRSRSDEFIFGVLGRVGDDKGTWKVVEALALLPEQIAGKSIRVRFAGSGTEEDISRLQADAVKDSRLSFVGTVVPADFYLDVDCAIVPTQWAEPFGRTAAEALMSGTPLLASNTGGLPEVLGIYGGRGALVHAHRSASSWANAMTDAISDRLPENPTSIMISGSRVADQYVDAYSSVTEGR